jgi:hypothetical protein
MKYEYDYESLELTENQAEAVRMGIADLDHINAMVKEVINRRATQGWEPFYPFSVPSIWFRKAKTTARRKKITKKS